MASRTQTFGRGGRENLRNQAAARPTAVGYARSRRQVGPGLNPMLVGAANNAGAAWSGFEDGLLFGAGDYIRSGAGAVGDGLNGGDLVQSYRARLEAEHASDRYDDLHYHGARLGGKALGAMAQFVALGPAEGAVIPVRIAEATAPLLRERLALGLGGAASGVVTQAAGDVITGRRSNLADYGGAAAGGFAAGVVGPAGSARVAGTVDGGVTSLTQDAFNGRPIDLGKALRAGQAGAVVGAVGGRIGREASNRLTPSEKGRLGETMALVRTALRGERVSQTHARVPLNGKRYSVADQLLATGRLVEAKFGRWNKGLSDAQKAARQKIGAALYRVDHYVPQDLGVLLGIPSAQAAAYGARRKP